MGQAAKPRDALHLGALVWVPIKESGNAEVFCADKNTATRWVKGIVAKVVHPPGGGPPLMSADTCEGLHEGLPAEELPLRAERDDTVDDLVKADFLHEPGILHTLQSRYELDMIYTYSGNVLIAVNPHKPLNLVYGAALMQQYQGQQLGELTPHVYAVAEQAFHAMMADGQAQAILISGESGAGKTETAKTVMQFLAARAGECAVSGGGSGVAPIEQQVLESNPLLEAFGNAKTCRNDNSSRFGKFVQMRFDTLGRVTGAAIATYLLERSRVVNVAAPERSFHIFYQLCAGADEGLRQQLRLQGGASSFRYLSSGGELTAGRDDAAAFAETRGAMNVVGMTQEEQEQVLRVTAAVLHLGNIGFADDKNDGSCLDGEASAQALANVAALLEVEEAGLQRCLMTRAIASADETIIKRLDAGAAAESRDALAKVLYSRLFDWLVVALNRKISALGDSNGTSSYCHDRSIGILDIYGFESFKNNSFEQLCINLANEKLQQQFNATVFKGEQEEYRREGIDWSYVEFVDNQDCLDLLEGQPGNASMGVFPFIDEACRMPRATAADLAHSLRSHLDGHARFVAPKRPPTAFGVRHYAGVVVYNTEAMLDKNKDFIVSEQLALLASSSNAIVAECFTDLRFSSSSHATPGTASKSSFKFSSLGAGFRKQLTGLMVTLNECCPHYIRCIKPNAESKPGCVSPPYCLEQLRAGGVLEAVRIACAGFPTRKQFLSFVERYALLLAGSGRYAPRDWHQAPRAEVVDAAARILTAAALEGSQIGKTRVFLRAGQLAQLEGLRAHVVVAAAVRIQATWRGVLVQRRFAAARAAAVRIQTAWRVVAAKMLLVQLRRERAALQLQTAWRMARCRRKFLAHRRAVAAVVLQKYIRRFLAVRAYLRMSTTAQRREAMKGVALLLQSYWRRAVAQRKVAALLAEKRRWSALQAERDTLAAERNALQTQLEAEGVNAQQRAAEMGAALEKLQAELKIAQMQASRAAALDAEVQQLRGSEAARAILAAEAAELRAAKDAAEARMMGMQAQINGLDTQVKAYKVDAEELRRATEKAEQEAQRLRRELQGAKEASACGVGKSAATIAALRGELAQAKQDADLAVKEAQRAARAAAAERVRELEQQLRAQHKKGDAAALSAARERNFFLSAKLLTMQTRMSLAVRKAAERESAATAAQEEAAAVVAALRGELEIAQRLAARVRGANGTLEPAGNGDVTPGMRAMMGCVLSLTPSKGRSSEGGQTLEAHIRAGLPRDAAQLVDDAISLGVGTPLEPAVLQLQCDAMVALPPQAWALAAAQLKWLTIYHTNARLMASRLLDAVTAAAAVRGLPAQLQWLTGCVAAGSLLRAKAMAGGLPAAVAFSMADEWMHAPALRSAIAASVADALPVDVSILTDPDRARVPPGARGALAASLGSDDGPTSDAVLDEIDSSPWKVLLGGVTSLLDAGMAARLPPSLNRALLAGVLGYVDALLLNALLLRREACGLQGARTLERLLMELQVCIKSQCASWGCSGREVAAGTERCNQAVAFLLHGKDELATLAGQGVDGVLPVLRSAYGRLNLAQLLRLAEQHHDAWTEGGADTVLLLQVLNKAIASGATNSAGQPARRSSSARLSSCGAGLGEEEGLVLDTKRAFNLPRKLVVEAGRELWPHERMKEVESVLQACCEQSLEAVHLLAMLGL